MDGGGKINGSQNGRLIIADNKSLILDGNSTISINGSSTLEIGNKAIITANDLTSTIQLNGLGNWVLNGDEFSIGCRFTINRELGSSGVFVPENSIIHLIGDGILINNVGSVIFENNSTITGENSNNYLMATSDINISSFSLFGDFNLGTEMILSYLPIPNNATLNLFGLGKVKTEKFKTYGNVNVFGENMNNEIVITDIFIQNPGNIQFKTNYSGDYWKGIVLNNDQLSYTFQNVTFENCGLTGKCAEIDVSNSFFKNGEMFVNTNNATVSNCTFDNTPLTLINHNIFIPSELNVIDCNISNIIDETIKGGLNISGFKEYDIENNIIHNNDCDGIFVSHSKGLKRTIAGNTITNCSGNGNVAGIRIYDSYAELGSNIIKENKNGLICLDNSKVTVVGNSLAHLVTETQQIIDNDINQVYASSNSFPVKFAYNAIIDDDNTFPLIYYDIVGTSENIDVGYNFWGNNFNPKEDLYPTELYYYTPIWELEYLNEDPNDEELLYRAASADINTGDYPQAAAKCKQLVNQYPDSKFAKAGMKLLMCIETLRNGNFNQLKNYYSNPQMQNNENVRKLAARLSNQCDIKLENYEDAIQWFEGVIQDPETLEDSIFAIIDLEYTYLLMENSGKGLSYVGKMVQFKPKSRESFENDRRDLMNLLVGNTINRPEIVEDRRIGESKLIKNSPNPFNRSTTIEYKLEELAYVQVNIYNVAGQKVLTLVNASKDKGTYETKISSSQLPEGIYMYTLVLDGEVVERNKMVLMK